MTQRMAHPGVPDDSPVEPSLTRRAVLRGVGAIGAAGLVAACGDGASPAIRDHCRPPSGRPDDRGNQFRRRQSDRRGAGDQLGRRDPDLFMFRSVVGRSSRIRTL